MKKKLISILLFMAVFFLGSTNVFAKYWSDYFDKIQYLKYYYEFLPWENTIYEGYFLRYGENNPASCVGFFNSCTKTYNSVYYDVKNVTAKSSNENVITVTTKDYDFSQEKSYYENFINWYNDLTINELIEYMKNDGYANVIDVYQELLKEKFGYGDEILVTQKPEWWQFDYDTEPKNWWEAYYLESEPTSGVEVIYKGHDLGTSTITLSADGKEDITLEWTLKAVDFFGGKQDYAEGLIELLNNQEYYKNVFPEPGEAFAESAYGVPICTDCNFSYEIGDNEDLSDIINALKGKDITINFFKNNNGIESFYRLNGMDIKNEVNKGFTYDHKISMNTSVNKDKIDGLLDAENKIYLDFTYHGSLPAPYDVKINIAEYINNQFEEKYCGQYHKPSEENDNCLKVSKVDEESQKYLKDATFTLLYYNPETDKMEVINQELKPNEEGTLNITFDHFSSYVIVKTGDYKFIENTSQVQNTNSTNNADTGTTNIALYGTIAIIALGGMAYTIKKKNN